MDTTAKPGKSRQRNNYNSSSSKETRTPRLQRRESQCLWKLISWNRELTVTILSQKCWNATPFRSAKGSAKLGWLNVLLVMTLPPSSSLLVTIEVHLSLSFSLRFHNLQESKNLLIFCSLPTRFYRYIIHINKDFMLPRFTSLIRDSIGCLYWVQLTWWNQKPQLFSGMQRLTCSSGRWD